MRSHSPPLGAGSLSGADISGIKPAGLVVTPQASTAHVSGSLQRYSRTRKSFDSEGAFMD